jgi:hypothetical protein
MSVGEAGVDGCVAAGALVCAAGDEAGTACAFAHAPFPASSKAIAPAAQHVNPSNAFPQEWNLRPMLPVFATENSFSSAVLRVAKDTSLRIKCEKDTPSTIIQLTVSTNSCPGT